jgi:hypothetical protein
MFILGLLRMPPGWGRLGDTSLPTQTFELTGHDAPPKRWLGAFVRSPGASSSSPASISISSESAGPRAARFDKEFDLNHVSLEKHRGSWHITGPKSKAQQGGPSALDVGEGCALWFGMAVRDLSVLRTARQPTNATFRVKDIRSTNRSA